MEAVRMLAEEIGPRPPCSPEEERAARWGADRLVEMGLEVELERFESRPSAQPWISAYLALSAVAALLVVPLPLLSFVLGVLALLLYACDVDGRPLGITGKTTSINVVARRHHEVSPSLVVVAELDSQRAARHFNPASPMGPRGWALALHAALLVVPAAAAVAWVGESTQPLDARWWVVALTLAAFLMTAAAATRSERLPFVPGAIDNASGVEALLRVCRRFGGSDIWWVLVGSGSAGNIGLQSFLRSHAHELGKARILNLKGVGAGRLTAPADEGLLRLRRGDVALLDAAFEAGADPRPYRASQTAAAVAVARYRPAMSIIGLDERGRIPHHRWLTDTIENVDEGALAHATDVIARVIEVFTGHVDAGASRRPGVDGGESG